MTERAVSHILYSLAFAFFVFLFAAPIEKNLLDAVGDGALAGLFMLSLFLLTQLVGTLYDWAVDMGYIFREDEPEEEKPKEELPERWRYKFDIDGQVIIVSTNGFDPVQMRKLFADMLDGRGAYYSTKNGKDSEFSKWELDPVMEELRKRGLVERAGGHKNSQWVLTHTGEIAAHLALGSTPPLPLTRTWEMVA